MPKVKRVSCGYVKNHKNDFYEGDDLGNKALYIKGQDLKSLLMQWHQCKGDISLKDYKNKRAGHLRCVKVTTFINKQHHKSCYREREIKEVNTAFASDVASLDFHQLKLFGGILDIPGPPDSYDSMHQDLIHRNLLKLIQIRLAENRKHSYDDALCHKSEKAVIAVKTDGIYQKRGDCKRGYSSEIGVVLLLYAYSGKFLDYRIMTKFCHTCTQKSNNMSADKFSAWREKHIADGNCSSNYEGPSTEMERVAVKDMFSSSLNSNLMYLYLVGDGDSKSFMDVWNIYGPCDHCIRVSNIVTKRNSKEYSE